MPLPLSTPQDLLTEGAWLDGAVMSAWRARAGDLNEGTVWCRLEDHELLQQLTVFLPGLTASSGGGDARPTLYRIAPKAAPAAPAPAASGRRSPPPSAAPRAAPPPAPAAPAAPAVDAVAMAATLRAAAVSGVALVEECLEAGASA